MAEWSRRLTRIQIPPGGVGSSPTDSVTCVLKKRVNFIDYMIFILGRMLGVVVAEWLRTGNRIPSGSVGSSPTGCVTHVLKKRG